MTPLVVFIISSSKESADHPVVLHQVAEKKLTPLFLTQTKPLLSLYLRILAQCQMKKFDEPSQFRQDISRQCLHLISAPLLQHLILNFGQFVRKGFPYGGLY